MLKINDPTPSQSTLNHTTEFEQLTNLVSYNRITILNPLVEYKSDPKVHGEKSIDMGHIKKEKYRKSPELSGNH